MNIFRIFSRTPIFSRPATSSRSASAPAARERLKVLLAHERASRGDSDLVTVLRDEILAVIARHMPVNDDRVSIRMQRGAQVSTLVVDIEIPFAGKYAA